MEFVAGLIVGCVAWDLTCVVLSAVTPVRRPEKSYRLGAGP